ncbi:acyltransferase family protein [Sphingomonas abietis]|uniref:Acyltransferase n=1 Tax=Sphingomonas abietis TaxID=3012344 RepID=A0ABY7NKW6_9SPHN|nr:acyltransferase [Sphingomonas abietis]WBO22181.1 acyltransferase [Sphingomonas abietis]
MTRPELRPLTSVRGLFAWAVVLYHVRIACLGWLPAAAIQLLAKGYLAVDFFFLLSGFVIWLNYGERLRTRGAATDFLVRRIARVWPLHAAMLAFGGGLAILLWATGRDTGHFPIGELPLHIAMMQNWGLLDTLDWNDPAWSISCEWAAYLLTPLAVLLVPARRLPTPVLIACAAAPLLVLFAVAQARGATGLGFDIPHFGLFRCLAEFACGAMLSTLWRRWRGMVRAELGCWLAGACCLAAWAAGVPETLAVPFAFATLLLALALGAERPRHPLAGRAIHWLGEISYATYLSHFLLFFAVKLAFVHNEHDAAPAVMALYLLIVLAASAALYHGVERPAQRAILRGWAGFRKPRVSAVRST